MTALPSKAAAKPEFGALLAGARQQEREVPICMRGDLVADHLAAVRDLSLAKQNAPKDSLAGDGTGPLVARIRALEAEMQAHVYPFRVRALPPRRYREFKAEHPIRIGDNGEPDPKDKVCGFNIDTGAELLARACLADPVLDDDGWEQLMDVLNEPQFEELAAASWFANQQGLTVPFWSGDSEETESSEPE